MTRVITFDLLQCQNFHVLKRVKTIKRMSRPPSQVESRPFIRERRKERRCVILISHWKHNTGNV